jgi:hypothetical protein
MVSQHAIAHTGLEESHNAMSKSTDLRHEVSGDEEDVGKPDPAYQEWLDQKDTHNLTALTSKATGSASLSRGQYKGGRIYSRDATDTRYFNWA